MKKILSLVILIQIYCFPQTIRTANQLFLENSIKPANNIKQVSSISFVSSTYGKKNVGLAILLSAILPGMGELYAGSYSSGKYFTAAEGALWGVYIGMNTYGNWQRDRYISYATATGGINPQGKNSNYYSIIGDYSNIDQYNTAQILSGNFKQIYGSQYYWNWQSDAQRVAYRNMWYASEQAHNNLSFVIGAMVINRIISVINAARLVIQYNKERSTDTSWNMSAGVTNTLGLDTSLNLNFQTSF